MHTQDCVTLRVTWRVTPRAAPRLWLPCARCETSRPFRSSGRFRVNAQKKRLDAWLIFLCEHCGRRWNCPLVERKAVSELPPSLLEGLTANDAALAARYAADPALLARYSPRVELGEAVEVVKPAAPACSLSTERLGIVIALQAPCALRLDRLLARELGLSRQRLRALAETGALELHPPRKRALRQPISDGQGILVRLSELAEEDRARVLAGATAGATTSVTT